MWWGPSSWAVLKGKRAWFAEGDCRGWLLVGGSNGKYIVQSTKGSGSTCAGLVGKGIPATELREVRGAKQETAASGPEGRRRLI